MPPMSCGHGCQLGLLAKRLLRSNLIEQRRQVCWRGAYTGQDPQQLACAPLPAKQQKQDFVGGLSRLVKVGYSTDVLKLDFSSLYPSIQLVHDVFPDCDITGVMKGMLTYFRNARIMYKQLAEEFEKSDPVKSKSYDRKQLPIKIFINSMFGALSAPQVFHWGDMNQGERITCT